MGWPPPPRSPALLLGGSPSRETPQRAPSPGPDTESPSWVPPGSHTPSSGGGAMLGEGGLHAPTLWLLCQAPLSRRICPPLGIWGVLGLRPTSQGASVCVCVHQGAQQWGGLSQGPPHVA